MNCLTPSNQTMHALEERTRKLLPDYIDSNDFISHIENPIWQDVGRWLVRHTDKLVYPDYAAFRRLHFLYHCRHASMDLCNYSYVSQKAREYVDYYWEDIPAAAIDIWSSVNFRFTLYIEPSADFAYIGNARVAIYYLETNLNNCRFIFIPQLKNQIYLQLAPTKPCIQDRILRLQIHTCEDIYAVEVLQFTESNGEELDVFCGSNEVYSSIMKAIGLYTYYYQKESHAITDANLQLSAAKAAKDTHQSHVCFRMEKTPRLKASYNHTSPKEHTRKEHLRHYRSGKVAYIAETVVNKGHTKYFS